MRCDVLEVLLQRVELPLRREMNRGCRDDLVVIVYQLRKGVFQIARAASEDVIRITHFLGERRVVEDRHHTPAHDAAQQVVEILDGGCAPSPFALLDGEPRGRDVVNVIEQSEQPVDSIDRAAQLIVQRFAEERVVGVEHVPHQVVLQREAVVVARGFPDNDGLECLSRTGDRRILASQLLDRRDGLVAQESVVLVERFDERAHRCRRRRSTPGWPGCDA